MAIFPAAAILFFTRYSLHGNGKTLNTLLVEKSETYVAAIKSSKTLICMRMVNSTLRR